MTLNGCCLLLFGRLFKLPVDVTVPNFIFDLRVRFFKKIQDWILNPRSCGFVIFKDTKNPKMDFFFN